MLSYRIHLIRTGSTSESEKRYVGRGDSPLCAAGRGELARLRGAGGCPEAWELYSSPLSRCVETASILYPELSVVKVDALTDMDLGAFTGKSFEELRGDADFERWVTDSLRNAPPGGESAEAFHARITGAFDTLVRGLMERRTMSAAVVTHGGVIMALLAAIAVPRLPPHRWAVANGCGYTLLTNAQMWMRDRCAEIVSLIP